MSHRGLAVVAVAALAPAAALLVPAGARADRHGMECFGGFSAGGGSTLKGGSLSCGIRADFFTQSAMAPPAPPPVTLVPQNPITPSPLPTPPGPPPAQGDAQPTTPASPATTGRDAATEPPDVARRVYLVADVNRLSGESDGVDLTRHLITLGVQRYFFVRDRPDRHYSTRKRWHPFLRAMGGLTVTGGRHPAEYGTALAAGGGIDLRVWESKKAHGWGNIFLRGQCDVAWLFDPGDTTWRCSVGPSFRDEDH